MSAEPVSCLHVKHTIVVSDIHLAEAEKPHPRNPLWKKWKQRQFFVDPTFNRFLDYLSRTIPASEGPIELVFNGDIFDFDSMMGIPESPPFAVSWLERARGLNAEELKSRHKMKVILDDHSDWVAGLKEFLLLGNRAVFVIGNHDMELHWPSVRQLLLERLALPAEEQWRVRFCEWFYISNQDTLIEHGNQYDAYSLCLNPIHPLIQRTGGVVEVRIPFGNLAGKIMLNGMGLMNPHIESSYIKSSLAEYLVFFYRYVLRTQPFLMGTWFWSACVTLYVSLREGLLPALNDPLTVDARVQEIAARANSSPRVVWSLKELHTHPAIYNPLKILRELWLDRALLLGAIVLISIQSMAFLNIFIPISAWRWFIGLMVVLMPGFIFYARSVSSEVESAQQEAARKTPISARIADVKRVIQGHTHRERHTWIEGVEYLNTGTWSPAFHDVECTQPFGRKCFAWIHPDPEAVAAASVSEAAPGAPAEAPKRIAELFEWKPSGSPDKVTAE